MRHHRLTGLGTALTIVVAAGIARAEPHALPLAIDCPLLGNEGRALLEARARAELAYQPSRDGNATIACLGSSAAITWQPAGAAPRERTVALDTDRDAAVDAILEALHALLAADETPEVPAAPLPAVAALKLPRDVAASAPPAELVGLGVLAGADTELWRGAIPVAIGVHAGVRLALPREWSARLLVMPDWGIGTVNGVRAWSLQAIARVDHVIFGRLDVGVGASARLLWPIGTSALAPAEQDATTAGALLALAYDAPIGPLHLGAGPELQALVRPIVVTIGGSEVFRVPTFVAALAVDVRAP